MARSHHRKKHKEHLRQFKHTHDNASSSSSAKGKTTVIFTLIGIATGFAISYFAAAGNIFWIATGLIAGGIAGFYTGHKIDSDKQ
jgi:1,4-dihydroxy-2-naphthoate octaprenyltransferase